MYVYYFAVFGQLIVGAGVGAALYHITTPPTANKKLTPIPGMYLFALAMGVFCIFMATSGAVRSIAGPRTDIPAHVDLLSMLPFVVTVFGTRWVMNASTDAETCRTHGGKL
jgi:hypothetical protein